MIARSDLLYRLSQFACHKDDDNNQFYLEQQKKELLELAEQVHTELSNKLIDATVNSVFR
jgi:hypothetical protein